VDGVGVGQDGSSTTPGLKDLRTRGVRTDRPELPGFCRPILSWR